MSKINFHIGKDGSIQEIQKRFSNLSRFSRIHFFKNNGDARRLPAKTYWNDIVPTIECQAQTKTKLKYVLCQLYL